MTKAQEQGLLAGKVVLVTGAGGGIGREIALCAGREGASVVVNDLGASVFGQERDHSPADAVVTEIRAAGGHAVADYGSVAEPDAARAMVDAAVKAFGRIDAVVNNAGNYSVGPIHDIDPVAFDSLIKVHLYGSFNVSRAAAEYFRAQGSGVFLHATSSSGLIGSKGTLAYSVAKGGIMSLSRSIALDMAPFGVRSNCIAPSAASRMSAASAALKKGTEAPRPINAAQPAQVAPLAVFMISPAAAGITGQIIGVRANELYLYNQPRPARVLQRSDGWTPARIAEQLPAAWKTAFVPMESFVDVFSWPPQ
jgi:NAD(P)-dependent dehydrogenase (short-subunit alcohol dehydrogenase family)